MACIAKFGLTYSFSLAGNNKCIEEVFSSECLFLLRSAFLRASITVNFPMMQWFLLPLLSLQQQINQSFCPSQICIENVDAQDIFVKNRHLQQREEGAIPYFKKANPGNVPYLSPQWQYVLWKKSTKIDQVERLFALLKDYSKQERVTKKINKGLYY